MSRKIRSYESDDVMVHYDVKRCIHAEECVRGLPEVFDPEGRPWIDPAGADVAEVARVVERCPTGALHYERLDGDPGEAPPRTNTIRVGPDGPLYLRGDLRIELRGVGTLEETRVALCRCGQSGDKPFCDGSHLGAGFVDSGIVTHRRLAPLEGDAGQALEISTAPNGPILIRGPVEVHGSDETTDEGGRGTLCRCGQSATKPFCDSTHKRVDFQAE